MRWQKHTYVVGISIRFSHDMVHTSYQPLLFQLAFCQLHNCQLSNWWSVVAEVHFGFHILFPVLPQIYGCESTNCQLTSYTFFEPLVNWRFDRFMLTYQLTIFLSVILLSIHECTQSYWLINWPIINWQINRSRSTYQLISDVGVIYLSTDNYICFSILIN